VKPGRDFIASLAVRTGLLGAIGRLGGGTAAHGLRVLAYHRVLPAADEHGFEHDLELVSAWEDDFDWQMGHVARHYEVITCHDLARLLDAGRPVPRRALIITFDDGFRDNHQIALPILRRHGVPAAMYVATGYLDREDLFWFDGLVHDVLQSRSATLPLGNEHIALGDTPDARRQAAQDALQQLKRMPDAQRVQALQRIRQALGATAPVPSMPQSLHGPMNWSQVRELSDAGMEIGSHSVSHPVLAQVEDDERLQRELVDSKVAIERHTGRPVVSLAYPVGGPGAYDDRVVAATRDAGYRFAFTYAAGPNRLGDGDRYRMKRLAVERYVPRSRFAAMLAAPPLFAYRWFQD
jgi:peptidoglycan/xylan/chitin deacetylase (PgdA/CDA1 family)